MMVRIVRLVLAALVVAFSFGCASITGTSIQSISIQTVDKEGKEVSGCACELANRKGKWFVTSPGSATITRSNDDLFVMCQKEGADPGKAKVVSWIKGSMFGNIVFGGGIGAIIDHNNGTAYEYPAVVEVLLGSLKMIDVTKPEGEQVVIRSLDGTSAPSTVEAAADGNAKRTTSPEPAAAAPAPRASSANARGGGQERNAANLDDLKDLLPQKE